MHLSVTYCAWWLLGAPGPLPLTPFSLKLSSDEWLCPTLEVVAFILLGGPCLTQMDAQKVVLLT